MSERPFFTVITATYKRGKWIKPTIESVLDQTERDFEYLVVGDGCTDDTEATVRGFASDKVQWLNLPSNSGSQSFANNRGIEAARGKWICYLGHDDIWAPDHLRTMRETIERNPTADFVVAGLVDWGPPDSGWHSVLGIFNTLEGASRNFTPPSSLAHRREVIERIGRWRPPLEINVPVDSEFFMRAHATGMRFFSTKRVSVHKFTSSLRYLSYLHPSDAEQRAALDMLRAGKMPGSDAIIARSKEDGQFMVLTVAEPTRKLGERYLQFREGRGLRTPPVRKLERKVTIRQDASMRAGDWRGTLERNPATRTSWMNPRPRILISYSGGEADFEIDVVRMPRFPDGGRLRVLVNGQEVETKFRPRKGGGRLSFSGALVADNHTILTLLIAPPLANVAPRLERGQYDTIEIGDVMVRPRARKLFGFLRG